MKKHILLAVSILVFAAIITGAVVLYNNLSKDNNSGGLVIDMPSNENTGKDTESGNNEASDAVTNVPSDTPATESPEAPSNPAPDFTMLDMNGNEIKLSDLRGKPVVLNFWASWCGYCVAEMPDFEEYYKIYGNDIHFVMLNTLSRGETLSSAKSFIADTTYTFPVYFDESGLATQMYVGSGGIPRTYFIDTKGNLVAHAPGMLNSDILKEGIDMIK